jgi:hypothetical protein
MFKTPILLLIAGLIVAGAVVNGAVTQRWEMISPDQSLTNRLRATQIQFEDWQPSEIQMEIPTNERSTATTRRYLSPTSGRFAVVTLVDGIPGSVSTHTPDVCYPGSGYTTLRAMRRETIEVPGCAAATYYTADFEKRTATKNERSRVRWAWSTDGVWVAPDNPRWQFAAQLARVPVLYKLYVVTPLPEDTNVSSAEDDPTTREFVIAAWGQFAACFNR